MPQQEQTGRSKEFPQARFPFEVPYEKGVHVLPSVFFAKLLERFHDEGIAVQIQRYDGTCLADSSRPKGEIMGELWRHEIARGSAIFFKYAGPRDLGRYFSFFIAVGTALIEFRGVESEAASPLNKLKLPPTERVDRIVSAAGDELTNRLEIWK